MPPIPSFSSPAESKLVPAAHSSRGQDPVEAHYTVNGTSRDNFTSDDRATLDQDGWTSSVEAIARSLSVGMKVWLEDKRHVYRLYGITAESRTEGVYKLALVTSNNDQQKTGRSNKSEMVLDISRDKYFRSNPQTKADMALLPFVHDPGILHNIHSRFIKQEMSYTFATSTCLISVNPTMKANKAVEMGSFIDRCSTGTLIL